jgi:hypothetical protein
LDKTFATGTTGPCDTFGNPPLIEQPPAAAAEAEGGAAAAGGAGIIKFTAKVVEVWGVDIL